MNNQFFDSFPYLQQMQEQFRQMFGDDFVKNLMNSMQQPAWWQNGGQAGLGANPGAAAPGASRFRQGAAGTGPSMGGMGGPTPSGEASGAMPNMPNMPNWMNGMGGWNPFASGGAAGPSQHGRVFPSGDVYQTRHEVVIVAEIPGVERATDIKISVYPDRVVVKGDIQRRYVRATAETLAVSERFTGPFERSFPMPERVRKQHAKATYRNGLLEIRLLKEGRSGDGDGTVIDVDFV